MEKSKPGQRCRNVEKQRGETIGCAQEYGNTRKKGPVVLMGVSILCYGGKVESIPSEQRGRERWESRWREKGVGGGVEECKIR
jgi:hypothetical protein